jgi:hypothetical protein
MRVRRIRVHVTETNVERHEDAFRRSASFEKGRVHGARKTLSRHRVDVVAMIAQQRYSRGRDVLVELDLHEPAGRL